MKKFTAFIIIFFVTITFLWVILFRMTTFEPNTPYLSSMFTVKNLIFSLPVMLLFIILAIKYYNNHEDDNE